MTGYFLYPLPNGHSPAGTAETSRFRCPIAKTVFFARQAPDFFRARRTSRIKTSGHDKSAHDRLLNQVLIRLACILIFERPVPLVQTTLIYQGVPVTADLTKFSWWITPD